MKPPPEQDWTPDPQLLAAYFDGELEGRDDMTDVRARLEAWLETHPEAAEKWTKHRQLQELWAETTPAEPPPSAWRQAFAKIDARRRESIASPSARGPWRALGVLVASAAIFAGLLVGGWYAFMARDGKNQPVVIAPNPKSAPPEVEEVEIFTVALANEVEILRIDGADTVALVVGELPLDGPMQLADRGEVRVIRCCPKTIQVRDTGRPMVWPRVDTE